MKIKILVAEDDQIYRSLVCDIIKKEGYEPVEAENGQQAIDAFFSNNIDLILLDVMMPIYDGWEVLKEIRKASDVRVIMLTALGDELHEVMGLTKGADDYISKPFGYEVFLARINVLLKKVKKEKFSELKAGNIVIDQATRKVSINCSEVDLNRKEYQLLTYLIKNTGLVLTREQILYNVWGYEFEGDIRTIDTHIKTLRAKLSDCGEYIRTIRGTGYMFEVKND